MVSWQPTLQETPAKLVDMDTVQGVVAQKNEDITSRKAMFSSVSPTKKCAIYASFAGVSTSEIVLYCRFSDRCIFNFASLVELRFIVRRLPRLDCVAGSQ